MPDELTVGVFGPSVLIRLARRTGRLDALGVSVIERPVASSVEQFEMLRDGVIDAAITSPDNVLAYRFWRDNPLGTTLDVRILGCLDRGLGLGLYGRPDREWPGFLRGARIGVDHEDSGFAFALYELADTLGVSRTDLELVRLGSTPRRLQSVLRGDCDATMLNAGAELRGLAAGLSEIALVVDRIPGYVGAVLGVLAEPMPAVGRLLSALARTAQDIAAGMLDKLAAQEAANALGLDGRVAARYVECLRDPARGLVDHLQVDVAGLAAVLQLRRKFGPAEARAVDPFDHALDPDSGLAFRPDTSSRTNTSATGVGDHDKNDRPR